MGSALYIVGWTAAAASQSSGEDQRRGHFNNQKQLTAMCVESKKIFKLKNTYKSFLDVHTDCHHCSHSIFWLHWHYCSDIIHQGTFIFRSLNMSCGLVWRMSSRDTLTISDCSILRGKVNFTDYNMWSAWFTMTGVLWSVLRCYTLRNRLQKFSSRSIGSTTFDWSWRAKDHSSFLVPWGIFQLCEGNIGVE